MANPTSTGAATEAEERSRGPVVLHGLDGLREYLGKGLGASSWRMVRQEDIDTFATLTGDK
jgi:acyl dehydratase